MNKKHVISIAGLLLAGSLCLSGCGANDSSPDAGSSAHSSQSTADSGTQSSSNDTQEYDPSDYTDAAGIKEEYLKSLQNLDFPEGFTRPTDLDYEEEGLIQRSYGNTMASYLWLSAWEKEWLNSYQVDQERADRALEELEKAFDMPFLSPERADDATRRILRDMIDRAKLGDPSGIQADVDANDPGVA